ncbi:MAG: type I secretion system permease/ATPase, partial [Gammaproteobacteria bacterium]|nr:type I secretion system permease/ATPase [Gammaproteobacteria bacterium]
MSEQDNEQWEGGERFRIEDPLLDSLIILSKHFGSPASDDLLTAGLPLVQGRLTPELFVRAADRIGLTSSLVRRSLKQFSPLLLPAVLLLKNHSAVVLHSIDHKEEKAVILTPESMGDGKLELSLDELEKLYSGRAFLVSQQHSFDQRTPELVNVRQRHWFWGTLTSSWRIYRDVLLASLLINFFALASPLFVMNVYDRVVPNQAIESLWVLAIGIIVVYIFDFIIRTLRGYFIDVAGKKSDILLSATIFEHVLGLKMAALPPSVGGFANSLRDFESIRDFIASATIIAIVDLPFLVLFLIVINILAAELVFIPIISIFLIGFYSVAVQSVLQETVEKSVRASTQKNATLIESLSAVETIKTLGAEGMLQNRWEKATGYIADWGIRSRLISASSANVSQLIQQLTTVSIVVFGVYMIAEGELSQGGLIAAVMLSGRVLSPMSQIAGLTSRYFYAKSALTSLNQIMEQPTERTDRTAITRTNIEGSIKFDQVSFSYPGEEYKSLDNITLDIKAGEHVGVIGRVGSGKSTLEKLILGLYDADEGAVHIDGIDIRQVDPADLRRNVGHVAQDVMLFFGSLRENIAFGIPHVSDEDVLR